MILWEGIRSIVDRLNAPGNLSQADAEKIRKMIEAGRNQRVDAMEMERSRNVAMGFSVNNVEGAAVTVGSKGQTKYVMKRKDKDMSSPYLSLESIRSNHPLAAAC